MRYFSYRNVGIAGAALGISGGEDSVDKHEGTHNLGTKAVSRGISDSNGVSTAAVRLVLSLLEGLHHACAADGSQTLHYHVEHRSRQRQLPCQQQPESHRRVNVTPCA